jgi:hypothetical protein
MVLLLQVSLVQSMLPDRQRHCFGVLLEELLPRGSASTPKELQEAAPSNMVNAPTR